MSSHWSKGRKICKIVLRATQSQFADTDIDMVMGFGVLDTHQYSEDVAVFDENLVIKVEQSTNEGVIILEHEEAVTEEVVQVVEVVEVEGDQPSSAAAATAQVQAQSLLPPPPPPPTLASSALTQVTPANQIPPSVQPNAPTALSRAQKRALAMAHPPPSILFSTVS